MPVVATFPHFEALPFEIREQIWQYALPDYHNDITIGKQLGSERGTLWDGYSSLSGLRLSYRAGAGSRLPVVMSCLAEDISTML